MPVLSIQNTPPIYTFAGGDRPCLLTHAGPKFFLTLTNLLNIQVRKLLRIADRGHSCKL